MEDKFIRTWEQLSNTLFLYILRRIGNEDTAEDILHSTFLNAYTNLKKLRNPSKLVPWIYKIAKNIIIDYFRYSKKIRNIEDIQISRDISGDNNINELANCINTLMGYLPGIYRIPMDLLFSEGISQIDISRELNLSYSGTKSRIQRARKELYTLLRRCCSIQLRNAGLIPDQNPTEYCCCED